MQFYLALCSSVVPLDDESQVAQAPLGTVNMTLRNSEFVWKYNDRTEQFKMRGKNNKIDIPFSCCVYNLCFYGVWRRLRTILASFSFSVFL